MKKSECSSEGRGEKEKWRRRSEEKELKPVKIDRGCTRGYSGPVRNLFLSERREFPKKPTMTQSRGEEKPIEINRVKKAKANVCAFVSVVCARLCTTSLNVLVKESERSGRRRAGKSEGYTWSENRYVKGRGSFFGSKLPALYEREREKIYSREFTRCNFSWIYVWSIRCDQYILTAFEISSFHWKLFL